MVFIVLFLMEYRMRWVFRWLSISFSFRIRARCCDVVEVFSSVMRVSFFALVSGESLSMYRISNRLGWFIVFNKVVVCSVLVCNCASLVIFI